MRPFLLSATARTAAFELSDAPGPLLDVPCPIFLDGARVMETTSTVFCLEALLPGKTYTLQAGSEPALSFTTLGEAAVIDVRRFGARGDGIHDDTAALQAAVMACPEQGTVIIPPGLWASGPLFLKSGVTVYLQSGATLRGHADRGRYPILPGRLDRNDGGALFLGSWEGDPDDCYAALITAVGAGDIAIVGGGVIDGNAAAGDWWRWPKEKREARRPRTIFLNDCRNVLLQGITVRNSPSWTIHPLFCDHLRFHGLKIDNPKDSPNTDGLDPESCTDVDIVGVRFSVGDDCIAIKSGKVFLGRLLKRPSRDIRIRLCVMADGHGAVVIGSEMAGGVQDVEISRCFFRATDRGLRIKTRRGRGAEGVISGIRLRDVRMDGVLDPFVVNCFYFCDPDGESDYVQDRRPLPVDERTPEVRDIELENVTATGAHHAACYVLGLPERPITGLSMRDVSISFDPAAKPAAPAMACGIMPVARVGFFLANVLSPILENVTADNVVGPLFPPAGDQ